MKRVINTLHRVEDGLLVVLLAAMIVLSTSQIVLRNLFDSGLIWADPILRIMVLWLGLIGAMVASRENRHIRIDLLSNYFTIRIRLMTQVLVSAFTATVCLLVAWHGMHWIWFEYQDQLTGVARIPVWLLQIIIPLSFGLIGVRYAVAMFSTAQLFYRRYIRPPG